jgi:hypothetical protein
MKQSKLVDKDEFYEQISNDNRANIVMLDRSSGQDFELRFLTGDLDGARSKQVRLNTNLALQLRRMLNDELDEAY